ncbi:MAG: aminoacetone oxidase family FAD-binding enzyme [Lachnospiraceae bacterium]|nr:aminoacetone oxidase family FAD-binding enzyme [Lachnospiraceae bacterium]
MSEKRKVGIIGGGAAGMMAAITAARQGAEVTILERNDRLGKKILATGNGKCNFTNRVMDKYCYDSEDLEKAWSVLQAFSVTETVSFFESLGMLSKEKNGYFYPACEQASVLLDALRFTIDDLGIRVLYERKVSGIKRDGKIIKVLCGEEAFGFDKVIVTCGGKAAPKTGSDGSGIKLARQLGQAVIPSYPALVQLRCEEDYCKAIAGIRCDAEITLISGGVPLVVERGELQLTDYGISGIPIFQLSGIACRELAKDSSLRAEIDFLPDWSDKDWRRFGEKRLKHMSQRRVEEFCNGILNKKLMQLFIKLSGLKGDKIVSQVSREKVETLFYLCKHFVLHVNGSNGYEQAQVSGGGVDLRELSENLESLKVPGVYFAGEVVDVYGRCGGYNLQWAWSSGYVTGLHAAK